MDHIANLKTMVETHKLSGSDVLSLESYSERVQVNSCPLIYTYMYHSGEGLHPQHYTRRWSHHPVVLEIGAHPTPRTASEARGNSAMSTSLVTGKDWSAYPNDRRTSLLLFHERPLDLSKVVVCAPTTAV